MSELKAEQERMKEALANIKVEIISEIRRDLKQNIIDELSLMKQELKQEMKDATTKTPGPGNMREYLDE